MIREANINDVEYINVIGKCINDNFENLNNISEFISYDYSRLYVYILDEKVVGFIELEDHYEFTDLINIAVLPDYRGKGIASSLIDYSIDNSKTEKILLEVNESNLPAINLYNKYNFKEINRRKNYYGSNDGIVMERSI